jgi:hypothetical protein
MHKVYTQGMITLTIDRIGNYLNYFMGSKLLLVIGGQTSTEVRLRPHNPMGPGLSPTVYLKKEDKKPFLLCFTCATCLSVVYIKLYCYFYSVFFWFKCVLDRGPQQR